MGRQGGGGRVAGGGFRDPALRRPPDYPGLQALVFGVRRGPIPHGRNSTRPVSSRDPPAGLNTAGESHPAVWARSVVGGSAPRTGGKKTAKTRRGGNAPPIP